jgi:hypothetical protein
MNWIVRLQSPLYTKGGRQTGYSTLDSKTCLTAEQANAIAREWKKTKSYAQKITVRRAKA